jgi:hypothetical protein
MTAQDGVVTEEQKAQFHRDGFPLVRNVLTPGQVQELRHFCTRVFDGGSQYPSDDKVSRGDLFCRHAEVRWLVWHPPLLGAPVGPRRAVYLPPRVGRLRLLFWHLA